jgi:cyclopropane fatty-acyl-phospholipid synthase-like methyltransferase
MRFQNTRQPDWDWWGRLWPTPGATLRALGVESGQSVVEIGAGNGYFALPAARITAPAPVYALDIDEDLLAELAHLADRQGIDTVEPVTGDAQTLGEHLPERVDRALIANTFHGIDDTDQFVAAVAECLADGGEFVVVNWVDRPREETTVGGETRGPPTELRLSPEETTAAVTAGTAFGLDRELELPPYHYGLVFERQ